MQSRMALTSSNAGKLGKEHASIRRASIRRNGLDFFPTCLVIAPFRLSPANVENLVDNLASAFLSE